MIRLAFVLTRDQGIAEELVQEAYLEVHRRWDSLVNPGAYLRRIVVNSSRRQIARRRRRHELEVKSVWGAAVSEPTEYLTDALNRLPERQRTAVVLAYYGRFSSVEIASAMECRPGTAKSLVHRGIAQLRKVIDE